MKGLLQFYLLEFHKLLIWIEIHVVKIYISRKYYHFVEVLPKEALNKVKFARIIWFDSKKFVFDYLLFLVRILMISNFDCLQSLYNFKVRN